MTTNKPEVVAWSWDYRGQLMLTTVYSRALELAEPPYPTKVDPLIRLADYQRLQALHEEELFQVRQDRDTHFGALMQALEQVGALQAECEKLRKDAELWESIHDEIHRRADKEHALADRCDFDVTIMYEDYAAIDAAMEEDQP